MQTLRRRLTAIVTDEADTDPCGCTTAFDGETLQVDASACEETGQLSTSADCRETVVDALTNRDAAVVSVQTAGVERLYESDGVGLLVAAGRFVEAVRHRDERLAKRTARDPLAGAREATGRADAVSDIAAETGLAEAAANATEYESMLAPRVGLTISDWLVDTSPPPDGKLTDVKELSTGDTARLYDTNDTGRYVLAPLGQRLDDADAALLARAYEQLATGLIDGGSRAPRRALRHVIAEGSDDTTPSQTIEHLVRILTRHTRGCGLLSALFADPELSDVFVTAPAHENQLRVTVGDRTMPTNVRLTDRGVEAFAARYRRESGRGFSRADPTLDAATTINGRRVRVAGVTEPVSDGIAFAFRAHDRDAWTLPALLANQTLTADAGAVLSLAVERGAAVLVAGPRGAGKTTLLSALLPELPPTVRTIVIEDAPELPVSQLQAHGRDVQALRAASEAGDLSATEAVRTALRLGDGALVIGEIRGEEAQSLYEAMRVGANSEAVLGTVHGDGADAVYDRVVTDLGVSPTSFGVTDLIVTLERTAAGTRRVSTIEEVPDGQSDGFARLFDRSTGALRSTGRLDRGNATLVETLCRPEETYAEVRQALTDRSEKLNDFVRTDRTALDAVTARRQSRS